MDLIRCNATNSEHCKWITLTYADSMTDHERVYEDGKMFLRRLKNFLDKSSDLSDGQKSFKRITVAEPQGENHDKSWHLHILLIVEGEVPFLLNEMISELWGYGVIQFKKKISHSHKLWGIFLFAIIKYLIKTLLFLSDKIGII